MGTLNLIQTTEHTEHTPESGYRSTCHPPHSTKKTNFTPNIYNTHTYPNTPITNLTKSPCHNPMTTGHTTMHVKHQKPDSTPQTAYSRLHTPQSPIPNKQTSDHKGPLQTWTFFSRPGLVGSRNDIKEAVYLLYCMLPPGISKTEEKSQLQSLPRFPLIFAIRVREW